MGRGLRILLYTALGIVLLAAAAVVAVVAGGPGLARQLTQVYVTELTGREFVIDGRFVPDWGRHLSVTAENIRLANPSWTADSQMLSVGHVRIVVDLWSLITGPVKVEQIQLQDVAINLERARGQLPNWRFPASGKTTVGPDREDSLLPVIQEVKASGVMIRYRSPELGRPLIVRIASLEQHPERSGLLATSLHGDVNGLDLELHGELGPVESLMTGRGIIYRLEGHLGRSTAHVVGEINELSTLPHPRLEASVQGPAFGELTDRLGLGRAGKGPFSLSISLAPEGPTNRLSVDGSLAGLQVDIKGRLRNILQFDGIDLQANISGSHFDRLLRVAGLVGPDEPFALAADLQREGKHVEISRARLEIGGAFIDLSGVMDRFPSLNDAKLDLRVRGSDIERFRGLLQIPGIASGPFEIEGHARRDTEGVEHVDLNVSTALGRLKLNGQLGDPETYVGTMLKYKLQGGRLADVGVAAGIPRLPAEPFSLDGNLRWVSPDAFELSDSRFAVGDDSLSFEGRLSLKPQAVGSDFRLRASGDDFAQMMAAAGVLDGIPAWPYYATGRLRVVPDGFRIDDVQGRIGDVGVRGTGLLGRQKGLQGTDLQLAIQGPDLRAVLMSLPKLQVYLPSSDFGLQGRLKIVDQGYELKNMDIRVADASFRVDGLLHPSGNWQGSELKLTGSGKNLAKVIPELPEFTPPPKPFRVDARIARDQDSIALDPVELSVGGMNAQVNADVGWPVLTQSGSFVVRIDGPDASLLPEFQGFKADALPFALQADGDWNAGVWNIETMKADLGDAMLDVKGRMSGVPDAPVAAMSIRMEVPSLAKLGRFRGLRPADQPMTLTAELSDDADLLQIEPLSIHIGDSDLNGFIRMRWGTPPDLELELHSGQLYPFSLFATTQVLQEQPGSPVEQQRDRVLPDTPVPLEQLHRVDATVNLDIGALHLRRTTWNDVRLKAMLREGALHVENIEAHGVDGTLSGRLELIPVDETARVTLDLDATELRLALLTADKDELQAMPRASAHLDLISTGATIRELASGLDGNGWLTSSGGRIPNQKLGGLFFGDFFGELLTTLNPFVKKEPYTEIVCIAMPFITEHGQLESSPAFVIQTDKINIISRGSVDLSTEKLDLSFKTEARKGIGLSAGQFINPFLKVAGTLSNPQLVLDPAGTLVTGGAAVATAGISILAKTAWDRVFRDKDPCSAVMEEHRKQMDKVQ